MVQIFYIRIGGHIYITDKYQTCKDGFVFEKHSFLYAPRTHNTRMNWRSFMECYNKDMEKQPENTNNVYDFEVHRRRNNKRVKE